jgi:anti-sigma regulatory factor (Ser/Thr protein kinase)
MDNTSHVKVFPARMSALPEVAAFTGEVCRAAGLDRATCLRLTLLIEELFTNTVVHGHGGDSDEPVRVAFDARPGRIALVYEDTAPPHDPFAGLAAPDEAAGVEERPVGGLGVLLVSSLGEDIAYRRTEGRNRISLVIGAAR